MTTPVLKKLVLRNRSTDFIAQFTTARRNREKIYVKIFNTFRAEFDLFINCND